MNIDERGKYLRRMKTRYVESLNYICAERLTPNLVRMANQLGCDGSWTVSEEVGGG